MKVLLKFGVDYWDFIWEQVQNIADDFLDVGFVLDSESDDFSVDYDIGISFMYTSKVPAKEVRTHKWYNFHPAPLPAYKGRNLCYHAIMNGEKQFGATLHFMDENFDTGPIIDVWHFDIQDWMTAGDVSKDAIETAKAMFEEYLPQILREEFFTVIPNIGGTYYKKEPIDDIMPVGKSVGDWIRAVTAGKYYPKLSVGGRLFKVVPETE